MPFKSKEKQREWEQKHKEARNQYRREWAKNKPRRQQRRPYKPIVLTAATKEKDRLRHRTPESVSKARERMKRYRATPEGKIARRETNRKSYYKRRGLHIPVKSVIREKKDRRYHEVRRQEAIKRATPKWLSSEQRKQMRDFKIVTNSLGLTVDHIIPLLSKTVCGLHVPWNLQALNIEENMMKGNSYDQPSTPRV